MIPIDWKTSYVILDPEKVKTPEEFNEKFNKQDILYDKELIPSLYSLSIPFDQQPLKTILNWKFHDYFTLVEIKDQIANFRLTEPQLKHSELLSALTISKFPKVKAVVDWDWRLVLYSTQESDLILTA